MSNRCFHGEIPTRCGACLNSLTPTEAFVVCEVAPGGKVTLRHGETFHVRNGRTEAALRVARQLAAEYNAEEAALASMEQRKVEAHYDVCRARTTYEAVTE